jgi:NADH-quinone oxidoreductase subunit F
MDILEPAKPMERPEGVGQFEMDEEDALRPRMKASILAPEVRTEDFREVELGFPNEMLARNEARRCLRCDLEPINE